MYFMYFIDNSCDYALYKYKKQCIFGILSGRLCLVQWILLSCSWSLLVFFISCLPVIQIVRAMGPIQIVYNGWIQIGQASHSIYHMKKVSKKSINSQVWIEVPCQTAACSGSVDLTWCPVCSSVPLSLRMRTYTSMWSSLFATGHSMLSAVTEFWGNKYCSLL